MPRDFIAYWEPKTVDAAVALKGAGHNKHAASNQFRRMKVTPNDTVWIVTVRDGRLRLVSRIVVGHVTTQRGAAKLLGVPPSQLWEATGHIIAADGTDTAIEETDIHAVAPRLRFQSASGKNRLTMKADGSVSAQQLQTMRILEPDSAEMLTKMLAARAKQPVHEESESPSRSSGGGFGQADQNAQVEKAAVQFVREWHEKRGWAVESVEDQRCGFDLLCRRRGKELHVEVKGVSGNESRFILTAGELRRAKEDEVFMLAFVPDALSPEPKATFWSGKDLVNAFHFEPIQFWAMRNAEPGVGADWR
jgi:hypothetical protein